MATRTAYALDSQGMRPLLATIVMTTARAAASASRASVPNRGCGSRKPPLIKPCCERRARIASASPRPACAA